MNNRDLSQESKWLLCEKYRGQECEEYHLDMIRISQGEPIDYVIGFSNFLGEKIDLTYKTLIPRAETEYWVSFTVKELQKKHSRDASLCLLDIFSGSGCIGVALARAFPNAIVYFIDIDDNAIQQINKNIKIAGFTTERCKVYKSDMFSSLPKNIKFEAIFANPPYIASKITVAPSVLEYEPHGALFARDSGLYFIKKTLNSARDFLSKDGSLYLEHDTGQEEFIAKYAQSINWKEVSFNKDQYENSRWLQAIKV